MSRPDEEDTFALGLDSEDEELWDDGEDAPGPDERDMDLLDGSWEERYYAGAHRSVDWSNILIAMALIALLGMTLPILLVLFR